MAPLTIPRSLRLIRLGRERFAAWEMRMALDNRAWFRFGCGFGGAP
jgi:hypothetical protein